MSECVREGMRGRVREREKKKERRAQNMELM